jgi:hypothetical protein
MTNSRAKGARGEREIAQVWAEVMGTEARRGCQFSGGKDSPDVVHGLGDTIHIEAKRVERGNPYDWIAQAELDCGGKIPLVLHRRNHKPWLAILRLDDVPRFIMAAQAAAKPERVGGNPVPTDVPSQGVPPAGGEDDRALWVFRHG